MNIEKSVQPTVSVSVDVIPKSPHIFETRKSEEKTTIADTKEKPLEAKPTFGKSSIARVSETKPSQGKQTLSAPEEPAKSTDVSDVPVVELTPPPTAPMNVSKSAPPPPIAKPEMPVAVVLNESPPVSPQGKKNCLSSPFQGDGVTSKDDTDLKLFNKPNGVRIGKWSTGTSAKLREKDGAWAKVEFSDEKKGWVLFGSLCRFDPTGEGSALEAVAKNVASSATKESNPSASSKQPMVAETPTPVPKKANPPAPVASLVAKMAPTPVAQATPPKVEKVEASQTSSPDKKNSSVFSEAPKKTVQPEKVQPIPTQSKKVAKTAAVSAESKEKSKMPMTQKVVQAKKEFPSVPKAEKKQPPKSPEKEIVTNQAAEETPALAAKEEAPKEEILSSRPVTDAEFKELMRSGRLGKPRFVPQKDGKIRIIYPLKEKEKKE